VEFDHLGSGNGRGVRISISFFANEIQYGVAEVLLRELAKEYRNTSSVTEGIICRLERSFEIPLKERWFRRRDKKLEIFWDEVLGIKTVLLKSLFPLILSYLYSPSGHVNMTALGHNLKNKVALVDLFFIDLGRIEEHFCIDL